MRILHLVVSEEDFSPDKVNAIALLISFIAEISLITHAA